MQELYFSVQLRNVIIFHLIITILTKVYCLDVKISHIEEDFYKS